MKGTELPGGWLEFKGNDVSKLKSGPNFLLWRNYEKAKTKASWAKSLNFSATDFELK